MNKAHIGQPVATLEDIYKVVAMCGYVDDIDTREFMRSFFIAQVGSDITEQARITASKKLIADYKLRIKEVKNTPRKDVEYITAEYLPFEDRVYVTVEYTGADGFATDDFAVIRSDNAEDYLITCIWGIAETDELVTEWCKAIFELTKQTAFNL